MAPAQKYSTGNTRPINALIIFVRYPEKDKVKTRLAEGTNKEFARSVYKLCTEKIFREMNSLKNFNKYVFYSEEKDKDKIIKWTKNRFFYFAQRGIDLGERMSNAFEFVLSRHNQKAIIIGTDIPDLSKEIILQAEDALDNSDIVIGPSHDGGYYLLGMKKVYNNLFEDIEWSSGLVFNSTMERALSLNLFVKELQMLRDIDTKEELDEWLMQTSNHDLKRKILSISERYDPGNF